MLSRSVDRTAGLTGQFQGSDSCVQFAWVAWKGVVSPSVNLSCFQSIPERETILKNTHTQSKRKKRHDDLLTSQYLNLFVRFPKTVLAASLGQGCLSASHVDVEDLSPFTSP